MSDSAVKSDFLGMFLPCAGKSLENFKFFLYALDKTYLTDHEGILYQNIIDFLLSE